VATEGDWWSSGNHQSVRFLLLGGRPFLEATDLRTLVGYKADLKRFENLRRSVSYRYADAVNFAEHEARIRKLLDKHILATDVIPIVPPVNIFDEDAFQHAVEEETGSTASKADAIASATARTITERMDADPVFYKRFSELVRETIEEFLAGRLSEKDYLDRIVKVRDEVVAGSRADESVPESVRDDDLAGALYRNSEALLRDAVGGDAPTVAADTALAFAAIVRRHRKIGWQDDIDVQNNIRNAMDAFLYDEIKEARGIFGLDTATMDAVMDSALAIARRQAAL
jgi:type I restriction enzyme, R subunit